jgi:hypothetical protein
MKKLILFFCLTSLAFAMTECGDAGCTTVFMITNQIDSDIVVKAGNSGEQITINSGDTQRIYHFSNLCGKGSVPQDRYDAEEIMLDIDMTIDGKIISNIIWCRKYWNFTNEMYIASYALNLTEDFLNDLESLGK